MRSLLLYVLGGAAVGLALWSLEPETPLAPVYPLWRLRIRSEPDGA